jgi:hypothetical protein
MSNFNQLQCHADWSPTRFPWTLGPYLGPDMLLQAQPNHMVPTLADTEGSSLDPFRKGACSPKFDCMACPGADKRGSKAIAPPSAYLIFPFSFLQVLYSRFLGDFASRTFVSGVNLPPPSFVLSRTTITPAILFQITYILDNQHEVHNCRRPGPRRRGPRGQYLQLWQWLRQLHELDLLLSHQWLGCQLGR